MPVTKTGNRASKPMEETTTIISFPTLLRTMLPAAAFCVAAIVCAQSKGQPTNSNAKTPTVLRVIAASKASVSLSWESADAGVMEFRIERRELGGSEFKVIATIPGSTAGETVTGQKSSYRDGAIQPYTPYSYRIVPVTKNSTAATSNECLAGPPLTGYHSISTDPKDSSHGLQFSMCLDSNDDPAFAYVVEKRDDSGVAVSQTLMFKSWNRAEFKWNSALTIDQLLPTDFSMKAIEVSLAFGREADSFAVAYRSGNTIWFARQNGSPSWKKEPISQDAAEIGRYPRLVLSKGNEYLAYVIGGMQIRFCKRAALQSAFEDVALPNPEGLKIDRNQPVSICASDEGQILLGCWFFTATRLKFVLLDPFEPKAVPQVIAGLPRKLSFAECSFDLKIPWIAMLAPEAEPTESLRVFDRQTDETWKMTSLVAFAEPPARGPIALATGPQGERALLLSRHDDLAPTPTLIRFRSDGSWGTTKQPDAAEKLAEVRSPSLVFCPNGLLYAAFQNGDSQSNLPTGIVLWREAPR